MLIIITDKGEFQTTDTKKSITDQMAHGDANSLEISFTGSVNSIPLEKGLHHCKETVTLHLGFVQILGFKEYGDFEQITTTSELKKLDEKIKEDTERANSLRSALKDPDYITIQDMETELKTRKSNFANKTK